MTIHNKIVDRLIVRNLEATINYIECSGLRDHYDWERIYLQAIYKLEEIIMAE